MDLAAHLSRCPDIWRPAPPATPEALSRLAESAPIRLPKSYLDLLALSDGGEGDLRVEPGWISLWPADKVLQYNAQYQVQTNAPGLIGFGSNGGGELLAFDSASGPPYSIVAIPFTPMEPKCATLVALTFDALVAEIGTKLPAA